MSDIYQPDQLNIETPEQVDLHLPIAGIGSRFLALLADSTIQILAEGLLLLLIVLLLSASQQAHIGEISDTAGKWLVAAIILFQFLLLWGYFALFEGWMNGQTPGKRLVKIRVIKDSGRQITLFEAMARNLLRIADTIPPPFYFVGLISMLCNKQQKRLGDFVAGTIVVHERTGEQPIALHSSRSFTSTIYQSPSLNQTSQVQPQSGAFHPPADAVARLCVQDLNLIESFLARALDFDLATRAEMARRIATSLFAKMNLPLPPEQNPERALEAIAYAMRSHNRL
jgi:uncharacterized RDD family membrane protein YckC